MCVYVYVLFLEAGVQSLKLKWLFLYYYNYFEVLD